MTAIQSLNNLLQYIYISYPQTFKYLFSLNQNMYCTYNTKITLLLRIIIMFVPKKNKVSDLSAITSLRFEKKLKPTS